MSTLPGPGYYGDVVVRGNTMFRQYQCRASNDMPVDLTGFTVRWRGVYGDVTLLKTTENGTLTVPTPTNGTINLVLVPAETRLLSVDENMKYELEIVGADASQLTVLWGDLVGKGGVNIE